MSLSNSLLVTFANQIQNCKERSECLQESRVGKVE